VRETRKITGQAAVETAKRLHVHCALSGDTFGEVMDKGMLPWLRERGQGRSLFNNIEADGVVGRINRDEETGPRAA
jgi:hypothetical protein